MTATLEKQQTASTDQGPPAHWRARRLASTSLRIAIVCVPLGVATLLGLVAGLMIGGAGFAATGARIALAGLVSLVSFVVLERLARRFLPLAMLLRLSLVFPDHAPSRFSVALRSTSVKKLQQWAGTAQHDDGAAALAEKVVTLAAALNTHDRRTRGHSDRSRATAELIAVEMGLSDIEVNEVRWGAFLHDIGKILVPASLLNKPGKPTPSEWETLKQHPLDGANLVEPMRAFLGSGVEAVRGHHENFDGSGYPDGLVGSNIPMSARIVAVADSFEVMTAVRSYKKPMKASDARKELVRSSGTQFDPTVVRALFNISLGKVHWSMGLAAWMAEIPLLTFIPRVAAQAGTWVASPTISVGTLSGVAALSLGTMVASGAAGGPPPPMAHPLEVVASSVQPMPSPTKSLPINRVIGHSASTNPPTASSNTAVTPVTPSVAPAPAISGPTVTSASITTTAPAQPLPSVRASTPPPTAAPSAPPPQPPPTPAVQPITPTTQSAPASNQSSHGNPHQPGQTGDPHQPGQHGNPHDSNQSGGGE